MQLQGNRLSETDRKKVKDGAFAGRRMYCEAGWNDAPSRDV